NFTPLLNSLHNREEFGKMSCTIEIQAAFILASLVTFISGLVILFIFRLLGKVIKKWQNKKTGIFWVNITIPIDLFFNAFFSFYFGLRFLAAGDKLKFWLEMNSIVDIFTIPPTFISYYLKSNWLGLRFLRALRLLELPKILQILQVIKTSNSVKFSKLLAIVLSTWFTAAGFIHLVENSGDPWLKGRNSQNISYFESIYLVMATTSTVGFGDVVAKTNLGRTFIIFFTLGSLVLFANYVPEMVELFANKRKYTTSYQVVKGKKFIVVCGNITVDSVTAFLRNFLRNKPGEINTEIVFLGEVPPSLELETIFKCYMAYTTFVYGSALKWEDLSRAAVEYAEACLIIANPLCSDSHAEDTSNIMRVLSIKNYYPKARIIIQILHSHNKALLPKIPTWNWSSGDNIICFAELKLGLIAQGCLVPGLCTFLTSLFIKQNQKVTPKQPWQKSFLNGLKNKIVTQRLSDDFAGMSFPEVSRQKLTVFFFSISSGLILNPPVQVKLRKNTLGFFIAESLKEVSRAFFYCSNCHRDVSSPELITKCGCRSRSRQHLSATSIQTTRSILSQYTCSIKLQRWMAETELKTFQGSANHPCSLFRNLQYDTTQDADQLDSSGMFHWCKSTPLDKVILKRTDKSKHEFRNHIVACVFGDAHSTLMGLRNFVMPLRASNYTRQELKDIVFIGSLDYLQREWRFLRNFPQIYIMPGSAFYTGDLHAVNIEDCSMCVILAPSPKQSHSQTLVDTETIMATLNIRSLRISSPPQATSVTEGISSDFNEYKKSKYQNRRIPILTELKNPSNIHFIEQIGGLEGSLTGTSLHLSTSFATGAVFSGNFLDSLLATAFYNYHVLELLHMLVTAGVSSQVEHHLDKTFCGMPDSCTTFLSGRMRCKLGLLSLDQTILSDIQPKRTFGQLFCGSLDNFGILCVGLYRMIEDEANNPENKRGVCWFVITRPARDIRLLPSDLVFCAIPFSTDCYKKSDASTIQSQSEVINMVPMTPKTLPNVSCPPTVCPVEEKASWSYYSLVYPLEPRTHISEYSQTKSEFFKKNKVKG
uniref:Potassium channel subfamily U member 1 n=1 Tax=Castor canadensis TaxID=51338 RepID=A0A8C0XK08_CASCN